MVMRRETLLIAEPGPKPPPALSSRLGHRDCKVSEGGASEVFCALHCERFSGTVMEECLTLGMALRESKAVSKELLTMDEGRSPEMGKILFHGG